MRRNSRKKLEQIIDKMSRRNYHENEKKKFSRKMRRNSSEKWEEILEKKWEEILAKNEKKKFLKKI